MLKGLLRKLVGKVVKSPIAREVIVEKVDDAIMDVADAQTGGLASEVEGVIERRRAKRSKKQ